MSIKQKGFAAIELIIILLAIGLIGFVGWRVLGPRPKASNTNSKTASSVNNNVTWVETKDGWTHSGTLPKCPSPLNPPVDLSKATSVLYPGQYRGGEYKAHGGFRFDNASTNDMTIKAPFDAELFRGARYQAKGDIQYVFDFIAPCGYIYRLGHLLTLSSKLQAAASKLPLNGEGDSHDTAISPRVEFKAGEVLATATGMSWGNGSGGVNVFVDWGVYDARAKNESSNDSAWAAKHPNFTEQHALCWFDLLNAKDEARTRSLPAADQASGSQSDYCK